MSQPEEIRVGEPHRPLPVKVMNFVGRAASSMGLRPIKLDAERLIESREKGITS